MYYVELGVIGNLIMAAFVIGIVWFMKNERKRKERERYMPLNAEEIEEVEKRIEEYKEKIDEYLNETKMEFKKRTGKEWPGV